MIFHGKNFKQFSRNPEYPSWKRQLRNGLTSTIGTEMENWIIRNLWRLSVSKRKNRTAFSSLFIWLRVLVHKTDLWSHWNVTDVLSQSVTPRVLFYPLLHQLNKNYWGHGCRSFFTSTVSKFSPCIQFWKFTKDFKIFYQELSFISRMSFISLNEVSRKLFDRHVFSSATFAYKILPDLTLMISRIAVLYFSQKKRFFVPYLPVSIPGEASLSLY